ncbi:MAG: RNA polymerase factor sigma-54 [Candidatus Omnitrophica bacterium]|nr:RNA polymerase factor sigma-54 [Candidatus Omnitrophota bacterium]
MNMKLTQKLELRKLLVPELKQSLEILALPLTDLKSLIDEELVNNPFLEERPAEAAVPTRSGLSVRSDRLPRGFSVANEDLDPFALLSRMPSLQDVLLRQLEVSPLTDEELAIGREIIGNLDENGYLKITLAEISALHGTSVAAVEGILKTIHKFDPCGIAARNIQECLLIQCDTLKMNDPLLVKIIEGHLNDVAHRKYEYIAQQLDVAVSEVEACVKKITTLDPKPGQNYSTDDPSEIAPDIFIDEKDGALEIAINRENIPSVYINEEYRDILKNNNIDPEAKEYLKTKLQDAMELLRAISRRQSTLRNVLEAIVEIQKDAIINGLSRLKPLTFQEVADKVEIHASTVCRVVMNKYAQTPQGVIAVKSFFTSGIQQASGADVSSSLCKIKLRELIESEDKKSPLSDEDLSGILLKENGVKLARRTVAKYREELKLLPSSLRRER